MEIYQWIAPIVAVSYTIRVLLQYKNKKRLFTSTFFWILFWIAVTVLAFIPNEFTVRIAKLLGFKSNVNAIIFVALGFLFSIVFYLSAVVEKMERQMTDLVRKIALNGPDEKESNNP